MYGRGSVEIRTQPMGQVGFQLAHPPTIVRAVTVHHNDRSMGEHQKLINPTLLFFSQFYPN